MTAYDELLTHQRQIQALSQIAALLDWDQETVMPAGAAAQRSEQIAAIEAVLHDKRTDPRIGDWLDKAVALDAASHANLRLIRRAYERNIRVPGPLATEIARVASVAHGVWVEARRTQDVKALLPVLDQIVRLKREEGAALARGGDIYDALLGDYEHGATSASLSAMFVALRPRLVALRDAIRDKPVPPALKGSFDEAAQVALSHRLAGVFGYDLERGRIDKAVHPFASGSGGDVRIAMRTDPEDPFNCIYSTIHEVGHGAYEQGVDPAHAFTPLGQGVSMGVHESQSRIYENQLGRSRAFAGWLFGEMRAAFGDFGIDDPQTFHASVNRVTDSFIRTEADEVQYNLHVMLRFDLEQALMRGDLTVGDLEAAWNDRFLADFGYPVDRPSDGILQDVHWSVGLFGYFPTYTLGNVYAGCLHAALRRAIPDLDDDLAKGDTTRATRWLRAMVQQHGALFEPREVITRAIGGEPDEGPLLDYLEAKFGALYGL